MPSYVVLEQQPSGVYIFRGTSPFLADDAASAVRTAIGSLRIARRYKVIDVDSGEIVDGVTDPGDVPPVDFVPDETP